MLENQIEQQLKAEFTAFYNGKIVSMLPKECRDIMPKPEPCRRVMGGRTMYGLTCIVRNGEPEPNAGKQRFPEDLRIKQELSLFQKSKAGVLFRLRVVIETHSYSLEYP